MTDADIASEAVSKALKDAESHTDVTIKERGVGTGQMPVEATEDRVKARYKGDDYVLERYDHPDYRHAEEHPVLVMCFPGQEPRYYQWYGNHWRVVTESQLEAEDVDFYAEDDDPVLAWDRELIKVIGTPA